MYCFGDCREYKVWQLTERGGPHPWMMLYLLIFLGDICNAQHSVLDLAVSMRVKMESEPRRAREWKKKRKRKERKVNCLICRKWHTFYFFFFFHMMKHVVGKFSCDPMVLVFFNLCRSIPPRNKTKPLFRYRTTWNNRKTSWYGMGIMGSRYPTNFPVFLFFEWKCSLHNQWDMSEGHAFNNAFVRF